MRTTIGAFPLLDYLIVTSDTVGAGLHQLRRYFQLTGNPVAIEISEESGRSGSCSSDRQLPSPEFLCTLVILNLRQETEGKFTASRISFSHQPDDTRPWRRLGCPVESGRHGTGSSSPATTGISRFVVEIRFSEASSSTRPTRSSLVSREEPASSQTCSECFRRFALAPISQSVRRLDSWGRRREPCNGVWPKPEPRIRKSSIDGEKKPQAIT